jgi:RimJ/RimL family protein N-acetyltransferase
METITTARLRLRPWCDEDADFLLDLESRWDVVQFLGAHPTVMSTREEALASIARRRALSHPIHGIWAVTAADRVIGNLLLKPIQLSAGERPAVPDEVEIGWHFHPNAWGHGYATEAASAVIERAFAQGLDRVLAVTHPENRASQAVCRRLGMTHLGQTSRYYDATHDLFEQIA